jgi:CBS domain-containing protein
MHVTTPMTREVTVVPPELGLDVAYRIMQRKRIRHLPVAAGGELLGMLSDRDVLTHARLSDDGALIVPAISCGVAMTPSPATCDADATVDQVVRVMTERKIDALPVVAPSGRLVGLVTSTDLLLLLLNPPEAQPLPYRFELEELQEEPRAEA